MRALPRRPLRVLALLGTGALTLGLCSCGALPGGAGAGAGSPEACATVTQTVEEAMTRFQAVDPADPDAAVAALIDVSDRLAQARDAVDDEAVGAAVAGLHDDVGALTDALTGVADGDLMRAADLAAATDRIRGSVTEFTRLCTAAGGPRSDG